MASRRNRRLQNLAPEEDNLGVCFMCQDSLSVEQLPRERRTNCCQLVMLHRTCFTEMFSLTSICGGCREDAEPENSRALPMEDAENDLMLDENIEIVDVLSGGRTNNLLLQIRVSHDINHYRQVGLLNPRRPGSRFWASLPYDIPEHYLFD